MCPIGGRPGNKPISPLNHNDYGIVSQVEAFWIEECVRYCTG